MHQLPKGHRNCSCKTFWSTFLVQLLERFCCSWMPPHLTISQWYQLLNVLLIVNRREFEHNHWFPFSTRKLNRNKHVLLRTQLNLAEGIFSDWSSVHQYLTHLYIGKYRYIDNVLTGIHQCHKKYLFILICRIKTLKCFFVFLSVRQNKIIFEQNINNFVMSVKVFVILHWRPLLKKQHKTIYPGWVVLVWT